MGSNEFYRLFDAAKKLARDDANALEAVYQDREIYVLDVKVEDKTWNYALNRLSVKSVRLLNELCNDLTHLLRVHSPAISTLEGFLEEYELLLDFRIEPGCIYFKVDLFIILNSILAHYRDLLIADYEYWKVEISASLLAFSTAMLGSASWYSLQPLLAEDTFNSEDQQIKEILDYAQKIILGGQRTPEYLATVLSEDGATVSINGEEPITAAGLRDIKFKGLPYKAF